MWLQNIHRPPRSSPARRRLLAPRLHLEQLDDRCLPAFLDPVNYAVAPTTPHGVVSADFNNDGRPDLAVATGSAPSALVGVLLGNGNGTFQPPIASAVAGSPGLAAVGDFDGDGKMDLVAADSIGVSLLRGNGDGTFTPFASAGVGLNVTGVAVGDFNGDGRLDLGATWNFVYSSEYGDFPYGYASVLLGDGAGGLTLASSTSLGSGYYGGAAVADLNGDANLDFVCTNVVLFGDGTGHLGGMTLYGPVGAIWDITAQDLDGDGDADLVMGVADRGVGVLRNDGAGGFGPAELYPAGDRPWYDVVLGDFNSDGRLDVADSDTSSGTVLLGSANVAFSPPVPVSIGPFVAATAGDFNGDGWLDLATTMSLSGNVSVLLNDRNWPDPPPPSLTIGDVTITEGNTGTRAVTFTVTLSAAASQPVTVAYDTSDGTATAGSDYQAASGALTFVPGETSKTVTVLVIGDRLAEPNENFVVNLSSPTNATIADGQGQGTIVDDEPRISIGDVSKSEGRKGKSTSFTFTITLSAAYDQAVTVSYRTVDGTAKASDNDYVAKTGTITFNPGETTKTITITVKGDSKKEADETFYLDLFGNSSNSLITKSRGVGTILNDD